MNDYTTKHRLRSRGAESVTLPIAEWCRVLDVLEAAEGVSLGLMTLGATESAITRLENAVGRLDDTCPPCDGPDPDPPDCFDDCAASEKCDVRIEWAGDEPDLREDR